jgi:hypothetical protein
VRLSFQSNENFRQVTLKSYGLAKYSMLLTTIICLKRNTVTSTVKNNNVAINFLLGRPHQKKRVIASLKSLK